MKLKLFSLIGVAALSLSACIATQEGYSQLVNSWVGAPEGDLIATMGPPSSFYQSDGVKYLTYEANSQAVIAGTAPTYQSTVVGNTIYTNAYGGSPGYTIPLNCSTTFAVVKSRVAKVTFRGNNCTAVPKSDA